MKKQKTLKIKTEKLSTDSLLEKFDKPSLLKKLGLSEFMVTVALDMLGSRANNKSNNHNNNNNSAGSSNGQEPMSLIQIVCLNPNIQTLNRYEIDVHRAQVGQKKRNTTPTAIVVKQEIVQNDENDDDDADDEDDEDDEDEENGGDTKGKVQKKKVINDDEVRKYLIEKREKELSAMKVLIGGTSDQYEKLSAIEKDARMVREFVGFALTNHHYFVYAYYIGPSEKGAHNAELSNPANWMPVPKSHLSFFHKRLRNETKSYYTQTKYDQWAFPDRKYENPSYDPRFIVHKWLTPKEHKTLIPLLLAHAALFNNRKDHFVTRCESGVQPTPLHYYDATKGEPFAPKTSSGSNNNNKVVFDAEQDRLEQEARGYRILDEELCHVDMDVFPNLARVPIPRDITFNFEEYAYLAKHVFVENDTTNSKASKPPDFYKWDPWTAVKPAILALNPEMVARRTPALIADKHIQILEADNVAPLLEYFATTKDCVDEIKEATFSQVLSLMATEIMTRTLPSHLQDEEKKKEEEDFVMLDA